MFAGIFSFFLPRLFKSVPVNGVNKYHNDLGLYYLSDDTFFSISLWPGLQQPPLLKRLTVATTSETSKNTPLLL